MSSWSGSVRLGSLNCGRRAVKLLSLKYGQKIAAYYIENESGATLARPKLMQLINDASEGDIILVEQIDRLARLD